MPHLDESIFKEVITSTPLVSIDLIIKNSNNEVLLGLRNNRPAKNFWFVPGGRIYKNETFAQAYLRIINAEIGKHIDFSETIFLGNYQHFYHDSYFSDEVSTHYVVLAYQAIIDIELDSLPKDQHQKYHWWDLDELHASNNVHNNTKAYFY